MSSFPFLDTEREKEKYFGIIEFCLYIYAPIVSTVKKHNLFIYCPPTILFMNIEYFFERRVLARCWLKPISCCEVEISTTHQQTDNISSLFFLLLLLLLLLLLCDHRLFSSFLQWKYIQLQRLCLVLVIIIALKPWSHQQNVKYK